MSADNGIYIAEFNDGFRVAHAQAIENVEYKGIDSDEARAYQQVIFCDSEVYEREDLAKDYAFNLKKEEDLYLEYGICKLKHNFGDFPTYTKEQLVNLLK